MTPEQALQARVIQHLTDRGHLVIRINQGAKGGRNLPARWWSIYTNGGKQHTSGISDLLTFDGRLWCWELKAGTGTAREAQIEFQREAARRGARVCIPRSLDEIDSALES